MKNARTTLNAQRIEQHKICKHTSYRFRNSSTEQVCLKCGAVRKVKRDERFGRAADGDWVEVVLVAEVVPEVPDSSDES